MPRKSTKRTPQRKEPTTRKQAITEAALNENAANEVISLFEGNVPDFVTTAVMDAIVQASKLKKINVWNDDQEFEPKALAKLFAKSKLLSLKPDSLDESVAVTLPTDEETTDRRRLARAISEILQMESAPQELYDVVADFVTGANGGDFRKYWTSTRLEGLLEWYEEKQEVSDAAN